jgi:hypothetical protein
VRTRSTRPGSGGRSTFKATPDLKRVVLRTKKDGTILELRAGQSNLQACLPGTVYLGKDGDGPYVGGVAAIRCRKSRPRTKVTAALP